MLKNRPLLAMLTGLLGLAFASPGMAQMDTLSPPPVSTQTDTLSPQPVSTQTGTQSPSPASTWKPHVWYGGTVYLSFGNGTSIGASPLIGWQFTPQFGAGVGVTYIYYSQDDYTTHSYGGRVMARFDVIPQIYAKGEFAYLWYSQSYKEFKAETFSVPYLFLGGGYRQRVSGTAYLELEVMFDVLQDSGSQYDSWEPIFAVGVSVGV
jgi:hypothetical protein